MSTGGARIEVRQGILTLSGRMECRTEAEIAVRMTRRMNGVVDVVNELAWRQADAPALGGA
nr:BON domain-containing protein [Nonomuraea sp. FMUSA5-5]